MSLEMRTKCGKCEKELQMYSNAFICSYECTFCSECAKEMNLVCPNCSGELVESPRRKD